MKNLSNPKKIDYIFQKLNKDTLYLLDEFYDENINFEDPIGSIKGSKKIKAYYQNMYKNVTSIKFDFSEFIEKENTVVGIWKMTVVATGLNGGEPVVVQGNSIIRFSPEGKAIYHRDYFDMGEMIYEHVPVVGFILKKIKGKFKESHE